MTREEVSQSFDPNAPGITGNLFGLPFTPENAELLILPVPWEVTVSYKTGTAQGPSAILEASTQVDLFDRNITNAWKTGIAMLPVSEEIIRENNRLRQLAAQHIEALEQGTTSSTDNPLVKKINEGCENLNVFVKATATQYLKEGKLVALLGGDHSTPLGFIRALSERYDRFGILQIDAHADLRRAYEGFTYSHASIMYNALKLPAVNRLVQLGIRDFCEEEIQVMERSMGRVKTFFDEDIKADQSNGKTWDSVCDEVIRELPELVYISFDIDGLDPKLCPNTGTPVAGGFEFHQITYLLKKLVLAKRKIIGFDLNEVAPGDNEWDANVGARMLYQLCNYMAVSQGKAKLSR
jgi:agmatinase